MNTAVLEKMANAFEDPEVGKESELIMTGEVKQHGEVHKDARRAEAEVNDQDTLLKPEEQQTASIDTLVHEMKKRNVALT